MDWWGDLLLLGILCVQVSLHGVVRRLVATTKDVSEKDNGLAKVTSKLTEIEEQLGNIYRQMLPYYVDPDDPAFTVGGINPDELANGRRIVYAKRKS